MDGHTFYRLVLISSDTAFREEAARSSTFRLDGLGPVLGTGVANLAMRCHKEGPAPPSGSRVDTRVASAGTAPAIVFVLSS